MCGIVGLFYRDATKPVDRALLSQMTDFVHHRGPDDYGFFIAPGIGFGHRRLSIIDLASGHQPMYDDRRRRTVVYNGEIYNYREVRERLIHRGVQFKTNCDTEVILKAAELGSADWVDRLNGMFAFAIWDADSRTLLLGRDRLGVKPLYYTIVDGEFLFSSEIKPILLHPKVRREVDVEKVPEYLAFRSVSGSGTLFSGIQEVPPGHVLTISRDNFQVRLEQFWNEGEGKSIGDYVDPKLPRERQLEELLTRAVCYRLISDVPVGSFNSGGVDSSLNSAIMRSLTDGEMHTFSVGFEESDYDETRFAEMVARQLRTNHHTLVVNEREYFKYLEETLFHLEEPINHPHTVQLLLLSRFAKQYVSVVLTGEGADEVFGGYPRLQIPMLTQYFRFVPRLLSKGLLELCHSGRLRKLVKLLETLGDVKRSTIENARYVPDRDLGRLFPKDAAYSEREGIYERAVARESSVLGQTLYFEQRTYLPSLLTRLDKSSMASALECRVPFLDPNVVEWSRHIDDRCKMRAGTASKFLVKKVAERWLPRAIVYRRKVGFGTPIGRWLRNPRGLGSLLDLVTDDTFRRRGYFAPRAVERLVREHLHGGLDHEEALWGLVNFELWCRMFIDSNSVPTRGGTQRAACEGQMTSLSSGLSAVAPIV